MLSNLCNLTLLIDSIEALRNHIAEVDGRLDILIDNAGMAYKESSSAPFTEQARNTHKTNSILAP